MQPYYNTQPYLYAPETRLERMLERACDDVGLSLSQPVVLWNPQVPERLVIARGTPYSPLHPDRMIYYAREYRINDASPSGSLPYQIATAIRPVRETLIDSKITPYDVQQSTYNFRQADRAHWQLDRTNKPTTYVGRKDLKEALGKILERYGMPPSKGPLAGSRGNGAYAKRP